MFNPWPSCDVTCGFPERQPWKFREEIDGELSPALWKKSERQKGPVLVAFCTLFDANSNVSVECRYLVESCHERHTHVRIA